MDRRRWLLRSAAFAVTATPLATLLTGCGRGADDEGLADVHWGRDTCAHCGMVISDRRFAAQVQGGPQRFAQVVAHVEVPDGGAGGAAGQGLRDDVVDPDWNVRILGVIGHRPSQGDVENEALLVPIHHCGLRPLGALAQAA